MLSNIAFCPILRFVPVLLGTVLLSALPGFSGGVVTSPDESSLRAALAGGGTVVFSVSGVINLASQLVITNDTV